jgi:ribosomal protein L29
MTSDMKKLEGLGKLLKAAGVKPAGAEAMVRDHIDEIQADARQHHAELIASVKALKEELVELRHNHASSVSEIRMATDVMRREIEARSVAFGRTLQIAKFVLIIIVALQIVLLVPLYTTTGSSLPELGRFIPASETANSVQAPPPTSSPQDTATK